MSKIITLPSGNTVTIRDAKTLKQKDRKSIYVDGDMNITNGLAMQERIIAVLVEEWSFDLIPPNVKLESLGELDIEDYDALAVLAEEAIPTLFPRLGKSDETEADPKVLTVN